MKKTQEKSGTIEKKLQKRNFRVQICPLCTKIEKNNYKLTHIGIVYIMIYKVYIDVTLRYLKRDVFI